MLGARLRSALIPLLACALLWSSANLHAAPVSMQYTGNPPFVYAADEGPPTGIMADLFTILLAETGIEEVEYHFLPTKRYYRQLAAGKINFAFSLRDLIPDQHYWIDESPFFTLKMQLHSITDASPPKGLSQLQGKNIGVIFGLRYQGELEMLPANRNNIVEIENHRIAMQMLLGGRVDYVLAYRRVFIPFAEPELRSQIRSSDIRKTAIHFAVSRKLPESRQLFETMLKTKQQRINLELETQLFHKHAKQL